LPVPGQNFPRYFEGYFEFVSVFYNVRVFAAGVIVAALTMFRQIVVVKHYYRQYRNKVGYRNTS
jgi:hypothetical protein